MEKSLKVRLEKSIGCQLDKLDTMDVTTGAYKNAVEGVTELARVLEEVDNNELEHSIKVSENDIKYLELKRDTIIKAIESACGIGTLGLGVATFLSREKWIKAGFQLEQTGTFTVQTFKTIFMSIFKK